MPLLSKSDYKKKKNPSQNVWTNNEHRRKKCNDKTATKQEEIIKSILGNINLFRLSQ